ncbi:MAG TPA: hypothetical protein VFJ05_03645 [Nitrososphaeraceae archaeon]|nr:hypothetical protein [Nitrososphaeraceae archaeon]
MKLTRKREIGQEQADSFLQKLLRIKKHLENKEMDSAIRYLDEFCNEVKDNVRINREEVGSLIDEVNRFKEECMRKSLK